MKKIFNTLVVIVSMTASTFAQDDIYGNENGGVINKNTLAANYSKDVYTRMIRTTYAVMTPKQKDMAVKSLNAINDVVKFKTTPDGKVVKIDVTELESYMEQSEVMLGSEIMGPIMGYEMDDDDIGYRTFQLTLDGPKKDKSFSRDDKFIAYAKVPYILVKGKHPYTAPEPLPVWSSMPPAPVKQAPAPVVFITKKPDTVVKEVSVKTGSPTIENNIYIINKGGGSVSDGGIVSGVYGSTAGVGGNYWGNTSKFGDNRCNNDNWNWNGVGGHASAGVSLNIVWYLSNPYYWADDYWWCGRTRTRVTPEIYGQLCSNFGTPGVSQAVPHVSTFGSNNNASSGQQVVTNTIYGHR